MNARDKAIDKIRKLRALAENAGATKAEALAAASAMARLVEAYEIDMAEVGDDDRCSADPMGFSWYETEGRATVHPVARCVWRGLEAFCYVKVYKSGGSLRIFGYQSDVQQAKIILAMLVNVGELEYAKWSKANAAGGRTAKQNFMVGFGNQISIRLKAMADQRDGRIEAATGRDLVVSKRATVDAAFNSQGIRLRNRSQYRRFDAAAKAGGASAGSRFNMGKSVGGGRDAIGSRVNVVT